MISRRRVLAALACAWPFALGAQQPDKLRRIGFFGTGSAAAVEKALAAFRAKMRELGYAEGGNLVVEYRWGEGKAEALPGLVAELLRAKVELIAVWGTPASLAVKRATLTLPIVMMSVGDPVETGLVASLARPGGNVTGMSNLGGAVAAKQMELLSQVVPGVAHVGVLRNPDNASLVPQLKGAESAARALKVELQVQTARSTAELDAAFAAMTAARAGAVLVLADPLYLTERRRIAELAIKHRLPSVTARDAMAEAGILMSYGASNAEDFRGGAVYVDKILRGAKPADLPVQQASTFDLIVNLKTAKALGITIPQPVLGRADRVIE